MNKYMEKVIVINIDLTLDFIEIDIDNLKDLQNIIGGYIEEVVPKFAIENNILNKKCIFFVNEEGKIRGFKINTLGTLLYDTSNVLVGTILLCKQNGKKAKGFSDKEIEEIKNNLRFKLPEILKKEGIQKRVPHECVGCGYCCLKAPCGYEVMTHGYNNKRCPELYWDESNNRYKCKAAEKDPEVAKNLYIGEGCCSNMNSYRKEVKRRDV
jgi:hypothetical protein